jgi:hypothetical protein
MYPWGAGTNIIAHAADPGRNSMAAIMPTRNGFFMFLIPAISRRGRGVKKISPGGDFS